MFPPAQNRNRVRINNNSLRLITPYKTSSVISAHINRLAQEYGNRVLDAMANHGGDTLAMGMYTGLKITAYEADPATFTNLAHNVNMYNRDIGNVEIICGDFAKHVPHTQYDVAYLDPPFGAEYEQGHSYVPHINEVRLDHFIGRCLSHVPCVVVKVPRSIDRRNFSVPGFYVQFHDLPSPPHKVELITLRAKK